MGTKFDNFIQRIHDANFRINRKPEGLQILERVMVRSERRPALYFAKLVGPHRQLTGGGHGGVFLPQASGPGIARVGRHGLRFFAGCHAHLVFLKFFLAKPLEGWLRHIDLATHLEHGCCRRSGCFAEPSRHTADGAHIGGDVFAHLAVAARGSLHEHSVFKSNAEGQAIDFQFTNEACCLACQTLGDSVTPGSQLIDIHRIVEAGHRQPMNYRIKCGGNGCTRNIEHRTTGREFGMFGFECAQLAH